MSWGIMAYVLAVVIVLVCVAFLCFDDSSNFIKWLLDDEPHVKYDEDDIDSDLNKRPPLGGHWR